MQLKKLLNSIEILDTSIDFDTEIGKITSDSRKIEKNDIFVAIQGNQRDGNDYIENALLNGASVIITDKKDICKPQIPYILVESSRSALSRLLSAFYGNPTKETKIIAITGTNGKTSTAYFLYSILRTAGKRVGLVSTIECLINDKRLDLGGGSEVIDKHSAMTTPDPEKLYYIFNIMKENEIEYIIIEASSHALSQSKLDGTHVDIGIFTNLSSEHLDYHKDIEGYFEAKEKLFRKCKIGIVNIDDKYGKILQNRYKSKILAFSYKEKADYYVNNCVFGANKSSFHLESNKGEVLINTNILGEFSVYNSSLACACAKELGILDEYIIKGIENIKNIKGRLEKYRDKNIYIDYAHTPKATESILKTIKNIEKNKALIVLFGCGGDRDKGKREVIGKICSQYADALIITSDNPRSEEPISIIKDILKGIDKNKTHMIIPNRKDAIIYASKLVNENSVLVLLGKGHEAYEIDKNGKHYFDEREVLNEAFGYGENK